MSQAQAGILRFITASLVSLSMIMHANEVYAQAFGVELQNSLMPASGAMGGTSIAQPQDLISAINANPASMTQFHGTQFTFGGAWVGPTVNLTHRGNLLLPGIGPFRGKSDTPGSALGNIGVTQDFNVLGRPVTTGVALISTAGLGLDYVAQSNSNNTAATLQVLTLQPSVGVKVTDRLSIGANFGLGIGLFDGLFVGNSKATPDYAARGTIGVNYEVNPKTKLGFYYQTKQSFEFTDAITIQPFRVRPGLPLDIDMDLPQNIAIGIANNSLANGRLLLAADLTYKLWEEALLFDAIYDNQLAIQFGAQYTMDRAKLRLGYVWTEDSMIDVPGDVIAGITPPGAANAIQYIQGLVPNINQHRFSAGFGIPNLLPGIDVDIYGGGMFNTTGDFGQTSVAVESYYIGGGLTWRFRRGSGCCIAPDEWCIAGNE